jgi:hypothetical protein
MLCRARRNPRGRFLDAIRKDARQKTFQCRRGIQISPFETAEASQAIAVRIGLPLSMVGHRATHEWIPHSLKNGFRARGI